MPAKFYRYPDLVAMGIVRNRTTLGRWIKGQGFPKPVKLGPNTAAWEAEAVHRWLEARAAGRKAA